MIRLSGDYSELAGIQYLGRADITASCLKAMRLLIAAGERIDSGFLLSSGNTHAFLLNMGEPDYPDWLAIKAGFSSGYSGEGPRSLSEAIALLFTFGVYPNEVKVDRDLLQRLDQSALTHKDMAFITTARHISATEVAMYMWDEHVTTKNPGRSLQALPTPVPWGALDHRLKDLANRFDEDPDYALMAGFRRLEDLVRERIGTDVAESKVFVQAFSGDKPKLVWPGISNAERIARSNLFVGAYGAFRNPRAHKEQRQDRATQLSELHVLNMLYRLESTAIEQHSSNSDADR